MPLTGSRVVAEELAQEAFLAAYRQWGTVGVYDEPGAWVRRVAVNQAASRGRRRAAEARALLRLGPRTTTVFDPMPVEDEAFWAEVRDLPGRQAQVVALRYLEDRSVDDIAGILGCAPATVRVHLHRGRKNLAERLGCIVEEED
jgi:RNA polymerase sigma factor (sigma-70 family)